MVACSRAAGGAGGLYLPVPVLAEVTVQRDLGGTKKTFTANAAASIMTRKVPAGELSLLSGEPSGTQRSSPASAYPATCTAQIGVRHGSGKRTEVTARAISSQGS